MKGQKTIELGGEKVTLRMTAGVYEDWEEYKEQNDLKDEDAKKFKHQRIMFALMELYATEDEWKSDDVLDKAQKSSFKFKNLGIEQIHDILDLVNNIEQQAGNLPRGKTPKKSSQ